MNIIVDKPQLVKAVKLYLNMNYGNLTPKKHEGFASSVSYVNSNNEIIMEYDHKNGYAFVNYEYLWSRLESLFPLNNHEIQLIMVEWLEETYKLGNLKRCYKFFLN
jgi:hypothetical protein